MCQYNIDIKFQMKNLQGSLDEEDGVINYKCLLGGHWRDKILDIGLMETQRLKLAQNMLSHIFMTIIMTRLTMMREKYEKHNAIL